MAFRDGPGVHDCKVYIGGLPERASRNELEEIFRQFGQLRNVWVARRPPGFAFVEFEDPRDAVDAVRSLDGTRMCGVRAKVELSHGRRRNRGGGERGGGGGGGGGRYEKQNDFRKSWSPRRGSRSPPAPPQPMWRRGSRSRSRSESR